MKLTNLQLEDLNETLAAATRDGAHLGIIPAEWLYHLCCEVQAWRRENPADTYSYSQHTIVEDYN